MKFTVDVSQTIVTTVTVEAADAQQALAMVNRRDFPLPPRDQWHGLKDWDIEVRDL